jgi:hypothetical protein
MHMLISRGWLAYRPNGGRWRSRLNFFDSFSGR